MAPDNGKKSQVSPNLALVIRLEGPWLTKFNAEAGFPSTRVHTKRLRFGNVNSFS